MLLVKQSVPRATSIADRLCLLRTGAISLDVDARDPAAVQHFMATTFSAKGSTPSTVQSSGAEPLPEAPGTDGSS